MSQKPKIRVRLNSDSRGAVNRAASLHQQRTSYQGIETWYAWGSFDAWLEQQKRIQLLKDLVPLSPLPDDGHDLSPGSPIFSKVSTYELHEIIKKHIMKYPDFVSLPEERHFHILEEPECLDRRHRLICAPDLVFICGDEIYLVEIKSCDDEEGVWQQLITAYHYFRDRFHITCYRIGVYVEDSQIKVINEPGEYLATGIFGSPPRDSQEEKVF